MEKLTLNVVEVYLLVIRNVSYVFKKLGILGWEYAWWKQFLRLNLIFIIHHLFKTFLICLVPPW